MKIKLILILLLDKKSKSLNEYGSDQVILSKLKIILILLISLISSSYQATLAEYSFPSIAVTTIPSAVNPGTQPQIQFPSELYFSGWDFRFAIYEIKIKLFSY